MMAVREFFFCGLSSVPEEGKKKELTACIRASSVPERRR